MFKKKKDYVVSEWFMDKYKQELITEGFTK